MELIPSIDIYVHVHTSWEMYAPYAGFAGMLEHKNGKFTVIKPRPFLLAYMYYFPLSILISMSICWTFCCLLELKNIIQLHVHVGVSPVDGSVAIVCVCVVTGGRDWWS